jgi:hypothetical protein
MKLEHPPPVFLMNLAWSMGLKSQTLVSELTPEVIDPESQGLGYYMKMVTIDDTYDKVRGICRNSHTSCALWAVLGQCEANSGYMLEKHAGLRILSSCTSSRVVRWIYLDAPPPDFQMNLA